MSKIKDLKNIASAIRLAPTPAHQVDLLTAGFELFSEETARLEKAYSQLKAQFLEVNEKLEDSHAKLTHKVDELHVLSTYLDNILSHMSQGLLFIDKEGLITSYNKAAEEILEISKEAVLYQPYILNFADTAFGFSMKEALTSHYPPLPSHCTLMFSGNRKKVIEIAASFLSTKEQEPLSLDYTEGFILLLRDITELKRLQMQASRGDRMKALGELAAQVAHEIRNPLGGIKGFASLLQRDLQKTPELYRLSEQIVEGANTLDRLVSQVLDYSRPIGLELKITPLASLIQDLIDSLYAEKILGPAWKVQMELDKTLNLPVDRGFFSSALRNLVINALQAMPQGGTLTLSLYEMNKKIILKVEDTGIGIPEENLKKIFSPFFTTRAQGNGLGLAEVHKVIQAHGGEINVDSLENSGTCFTISLPLSLF